MRYWRMQKQKYAQAQQQAVQTLESQKGSEGAAPDAKKPRGVWAYCFLASSANNPSHKLKL